MTLAGYKPVIMFYSLKKKKNSFSKFQMLINFNSNYFVLNVSFPSVH